jgi:hypothetical protein
MSFQYHPASDFATPNASDHFHLLRLRCSRTGTPGLSGGLVTSVLGYGVRLALVLGHAGVDMPGRVLANIPFFAWSEVLLESEVAYWTMSARMGALKTLGKGWVFWLAAPSAPMMVTVGRDILTAMWLVGTVRIPAIVDTSRLQKVRRSLILLLPPQICGCGPCCDLRDGPSWQAAAA